MNIFVVSIIPFSYPEKVTSPLSELDELPELDESADTEEPEVTLDESVWL